MSPLPFPDPLAGAATASVAGATMQRPGGAGTGTTTIVTRVRDWAARLPERVALREKDFGVWQEVTWQGYWDTVLDVAHALIALGVEPGDRVAIPSETRR